MTTTAPDVGLLEALDWELACQVSRCEAGHPTATHLVRGLRCECFVPYCTPCAGTVRISLDKFGSWYCKPCGGGFIGTGRGSEFFRIEPLP